MLGVILMRKGFIRPLNSLSFSWDSLELFLVPSSGNMKKNTCTYT